MMKLATAMLALLALGACREATKEQTNVARPAQPAPQPAPAHSPPPKPAPNPLTPQRPTIDPRSTEAAEQLVRGFVDLLNRGKLGDAYMLLGPGAPPRAQFERNFSRFSDLRVTQGAAGDQEGAAGSIYLSVPLEVSGTLNGRRTTRSATAIVRRVNDVPGSTEAQRRWHIERIDWGTAA